MIVVARTSSVENSREPIVITGIGAVSPLGHSFDAITDSLMAGRTGVRSIDPGEFARESHQFAAAVDVIPAPPDGSCVLDGQGFASLTRLEQMVLSPVAHAVADAGLGPHRDRLRIGLVLGLGAEQLKRWELDFLAGGTQVFAPSPTDTLVHQMARMTNLRGPAVTVAAACASSGYAMALAVFHVA
jgi:3-oxoacyl-[acyl-carrier-protein] synthase II